ncbi:uncharacterized protein LOC119070588 [Bradysia coprophila]|uniref:uncharacterized protein LOC119070588 n=1 Tax=Bradysia coprophila TaxID=38358 RepID=UPI00187D8941|nr:uncharacterized protein LOC119070588 [Bradysia coprophila]
MKTSFLAVLLLLFCIQTSLTIAGGNTNTPTNHCKSELTQLRQNASKFIARLKQILDSGHNTLAGIVELDAKLFKIEHYYLSDSYATDVKTASTKLKSFVDGFTAPSTELSNFINSVHDDCDTMLNLADDFAKENKLTFCPKVALKGCEAELGTLQCELFDLLKELKKQREKAMASITVMKSTVSNLGEMVKEFASTHLTRPHAGIDVDCCKLRTAANRFFVEFNQRHWVGYQKFVKLQFVCDEITTCVSVFDVKLKCIK